MAHKVKTMNMYLPVVDRQAVAGADLHTTIDVNMQDFCENALVQKLKEIDGMYGVAILMEVKTGDIKAMANMERVAEGTYSDIRNYAVFPPSYSKIIESHPSNASSSALLISLQENFFKSESP